MTGCIWCESRTDSVKSETLEDYFKVAGIKEDAAKGKLNEAIATNDGIITHLKRKCAEERWFPEDEAKIVADVDDIFSVTQMPWLQM